MADEMDVSLKEKLIYYSIWLAFEMGARQVPSVIRALDHSDYARFSLHLLSARLLGKEGRLELAAEEYNRCLEQRPSDRQVASELRHILHELTLAGQRELVQQILQSRKDNPFLLQVGADDLASVDENEKAPEKKMKSDKAIVGAFLGFVSLMIMGDDNSSDVVAQEQYVERNSSARSQAYPTATTLTLPGLASSTGATKGESKSQTITGEALDFIINAIEVIHATLIFTLKKNYAVNPGTVLMTAARTLFLILAHVYMWYLLGHSFPPGIASYWWVTGGFSVWILTTTGFAKSHSKEYIGQWYNRNRIPFGAIFLKDALFEISSVIVSTVLSFIFLYLLGQRQFYDSPISLDFTLIFALLVLAYLLGISLGAILDMIGEAFHVHAGFLHYAMWPIFITSGVYNNFHSSPPAAQNVMVFNPVLHVIEYMRHAFDPQYSVEGLTLSYPVGLSLLGIFFYAWIMLHNSQVTLKRSRFR